MICKICIVMMKNKGSSKLLHKKKMKNFRTRFRYNSGQSESLMRKITKMFSSFSIGEH